MTYQRKLPKWLGFAELPAYLRDELVAMDENKERCLLYQRIRYSGMRGLIVGTSNIIYIYS